MAIEIWHAKSKIYKMMPYTWEDNMNLCLYAMEAILQKHILSSVTPIMFTPPEAGYMAPNEPMMALLQIKKWQMAGMVMGHIFKQNNP